MPNKYLQLLKTIFNSFCVVHDDENDKSSNFELIISSEHDELKKSSSV
jgi:hypothetical protein